VRWCRCIEAVHCCAATKRSSIRRRLGGGVLLLLGVAAAASAGSGGSVSSLCLPPSPPPPAFSFSSSCSSPSQVAVADKGKTPKVARVSGPTVGGFCRRLARVSRGRGAWMASGPLRAGWDTWRASGRAWLGFRRDSVVGLPRPSGKGRAGSCAACRGAGEARRRCGATLMRAERGRGKAERSGAERLKLREKADGCVPAISSSGGGGGIRPAGSRAGLSSWPARGAGLGYANGPCGRVAVCRRCGRARLQAGQVGGAGVVGR
jgi:hypothetical protein